MDFSFHDAEIIAYSVDLENKKIILKVKNNNQKWEIIFDDFIAFEFCDFGFQNIIFDITNYSWNEFFENKENFDFAINILSKFFYNALKNFDKISQISKEIILKIFNIISSVWLNWIIFAWEMEKKLFLQIKILK